MEIIKSSDFTRYLTEKVHQTNEPDEAFEQKLSSALITAGKKNFSIKNNGFNNENTSN
jgi:hypothetical protein